MSPTALKVVAIDYQKGLLDRLNEEIKGTDLEGLSAAQTVITTAPRLENTLAFSYASQALNNSFFFDNLLPPGGSPSSNDTVNPTSHEHTMSSNLRAIINDSFGSLDQLKSTMSAAALGMMSSGWVWLVCDDSATSLAVVPSFGPGTMLVRSRQHRHPESIALDVGPRTGQTPYNILGEALSTKGAFSDPFPKGRQQQPSSSPQQFGPMSSNMPRSRTFYSSAPHRSPLPTTSLAYDPFSSKPRFSQTSLPWTELEPLSKSNGSASLSTHRSMAVQRYSTGRSGDGNATSSGLLQDDRPMDSAQSRTLRNLGSEFARSRPSSLRSTSVRIRGVEDDMCPLMCISVHEHMWMAGGYGVWGKEEYLRRLWPVVNWKKISAILELWRSQGPAKS